MHSFIFVIHHECSYVGGMVVISANNLDQATTIFRSLTWNDVMKPGQEKGWPENVRKELILENDSLDIVLAEYPKELPKELKASCYNVWCLLQQMPLSGEYDEAGFVAFAYHDG